MTQFALAARSPIRNVLLCTLATLTLAACGSESGSSAAAAAAAESDTTTASLVSPTAGTIDRSQTSASNTATTSGTSSTVSTASVTPPSTTSTTSASTPATQPAVASTSGVVTLDWMPPTENADGSVLTNLAGYTVYYGTSPDKLTQSIKVTNPGLASYTVSNLSSGTWYFAVTAISAAGAESSRTTTVSTKI